MKLVILTRPDDGARVYVNPQNVCAVYPYYNRDTTVIRFAGGDDSYVEVLESVDYVANMLQDAGGR